MASCRFEWAVLMLVILKITFAVSQESCEKIDVCVCLFKNGSIVNLWPVDGGSEGPSFTKIPGQSGRYFDWNPCTPFNESSGITGCIDVTVCEVAGLDGYPAGDDDTSFTVDSSGNVVITYGFMTGDEGHKRETAITLKCDPKGTGKGTIDKGFVETILSPTSSRYSGTLTSKYACAFPILRGPIDA